ncbi:MAG: MotA/TolQ/ExbB proton channel family protein [Candidatus Manganitrophaceae bacterium]|nr:MAG: MotA/TolQ/ExbB proton channel family protein [Candidatus Manganitrophaceae bacterium]
MDEIFHRLALLGDVWILWLLIAASVVSFGVMLERWSVFRINRLDFPRFLEELSGRLEAGDLAGARQAAQKARGVEGRVAAAGLEHFTKGAASVEEAMTSRLVLERAILERNLIILGSLGNNAPFIGLFGTVLGIIKAFNDLAVSGQSGVGVVMVGISSALIATAFGIFVAIPAVAANNVFHIRVKRVSANAQSLIHRVQVYLRDETKRGPQSLVGAAEEEKEEVRA